MRVGLGDEAEAWHQKGEERVRPGTAAGSTGSL